MKLIIRKLLRLFGVIGITILFGVVLLLAILRYFHPSLHTQRAIIEELITRTTQQPVQIGAINLSTHNVEPVIQLHDVVILNADRKSVLFTIQEVDLGIDLFGSLFNWHPTFGLLVIKGTELSLEEDAQGKVQVMDVKALNQGVNVVPAALENMVKWLFTQGQIELADLALTWKPQHGDIDKFTNLDLVLINRFSVHELQVAGDLLQAPKTAHLEAQLKIRGDILQRERFSVSGAITTSDLSVKLPNFHAAKSFSFLINDGDITLHATNFTIDFGKLFRAPLLANTLDTYVLWQYDNAKWHVYATKVKASNSQVALNGDCDLILPDDPAQSSQADMRFNFKFVDIGKIKLYFPMTAIPADGIAWMDNAFRYGKSVSGKMLLQGPLDKFPFDASEGHFLITADVADITLHYQDGWPDIEKINGKLIFENRGMRVLVNTAKILGIPTSQISAEIPDLSTPALKVVGALNADASAGLRFIFASPLQKTIGRNLQNLNLTGPIQLNLQLYMPLSDELKGQKTAVDGRVMLQNNNLQVSDWNINFTQLNGAFKFTADSLSATQLTARLFQQPVTLTITSQPVGVDDTVTTVNFSGKATIQDLQNTLAFNVAAYAAGGFNYAAALALHSNDTQINTLKISSDLQGVALTLPEPYGKAANVVRELTLTSSFVSNQVTRIFIKYAEQLSAALTFTKKPHVGFKFTSGELRFGTKDAVPQTVPGLLIAGDLDNVIWPQWQSFVFNKIQPTKTANLLRKIDLQIKRLRIFGQDLSGVTLLANPTAQGWTMSLNSSKIQGTFWILQGGVKQQISGEFKRFYAAENAKQFTELKPQELPPLHFVIDDFHYGDKDFGRIEFTTEPQKTGLAINKLQLSGTNYMVDAWGVWNQIGGKQETTLQGKFNSKDVGALLKHLDLAGSLIGGVTDINFALVWPNAPYAPTLRTILGRFNILVRNGRIINLSSSTEAEIGFGRVLNLLSLQTLPRRLTLDFSDLTKAGFGFDTLRGQAEIHNGDVYTNAITLDGTVAQVKVKGRIGLIANDYDLLLATTPHITSSIPVIAAIAVNPIVGIATWAAEKVIGAGMKKVTTYSYRVTGPWQAPNVVKI